MSTSTQCVKSDRILNLGIVSKSSFSWWLKDALLLGQRNLRCTLRSPDLVFYSLLQPVMFMFLFGFIFGGAIRVPGMNYHQFLLPGILVQMVIFGSVSATAIGVAEDMQHGIMDRFRSLPIATSAVLVGRQATEILRTVLTVTVITIASRLVGFRFYGGISETLAGFGLLLLCGFAFSCLAVFIGLSVGSVRAAQSAGLVWLFPFVFVSSAYVPTATMPGWLRIFAEHSPVTAVVNTLRAWFAGQPAGGAAWISLGWSLALIVIFMPLSIARFERRDI